MANVNQLEQAIKVFKKGLEWFFLTSPINKKGAEKRKECWIYNLGVIFYAIKKLWKIERDYKIVLEFCSKDVNALNNLGTIYTQKDKLEKTKNTLGSLDSSSGLCLDLS